MLKKIDSITLIWDTQRAIVKHFKRGCSLFIGNRPINNNKYSNYYIKTIANPKKVPTDTNTQSHKVDQFSRYKKTSNKW